MGLEETYYATIKGEQDYPTVVRPGYYYCYNRNCKGVWKFNVDSELKPCPKCGGRIFFTQ
ncbi:MAG: hypothetical protein IKO76_06710 [Butyrivibrio sp.]|nr:hypothetical protein [Butyrivibrio sp.]